MTNASKADLVLKSVATAVVATAIVETGQGVVKTLVKQPLVLFGLGIVAGYLTHKYRKEIITLSNHTAKQGKNLLLQQKQQLTELLSEAQQE